MFWQDEVTGVLVATDNQPGRAFTPYDQYLTELLAGQVVAFIQNARLFEATQRSLNYTQALLDISRHLSAVEDLHDILDSIADAIVEGLSADRALLIVIDEDAQQVVDYAGAGDEKADIRLPPYEELLDGLTGWVIREREPLISPKGAPDSRESPLVQQHRLDYGVGSIITVPMIYRDQLLGTITAMNRLESRDFSSEDLQLAVAIGNQAAAAITNAQLFTQMQQALQRAEVLYAAGRSVMSIEDLSSVLHQITEGVARALPADRVSLITFDIAAHQVTHFVRGGPGSEHIALDVDFAELWDGLSGWALRELKPALSLKGVPDPRESPEVQRRRAETECGAIIVVPIIYRGEVLGTMTAINRLDQPDFSPADVDLMVALVNQVAAAVANAELFANTQQALAETAVLYEASRALTLAHTPADVLQVFVEQVVGPDIDRCVIAQLMGGKREDIPVVEITAAWDLGGERPALLGRRFDTSQVPVMARFDREPVVVPDIAASSLIDPQSKRMFLEVFGVRAVAVVTLFVGERLMGWLLAESTAGPRDFPDREVRLYRSLQGQAGVALDNMRLLAEMRKRATQLQTAAEVARAASSILNIDDLLGEAVTLLRERFDLYYAGLFLLDDSETFAVLRAGTGEPGVAMLAEGHRLRVGGESMIGACVTDATPRIALDVGKERVRFDNPHLPRTRSELALPLVARGKVIGAMTIQSEMQAAFSQEDITSLRIMADQLATAIANALLFAESEVRFEELQRLQRQLTGSAWSDYVRGQPVLGYTYDLAQLRPLHDQVVGVDEEPTPEALAEALTASMGIPLDAAVVPVLQQGDLVVRDDNGRAVLAPITTPLGEPLGILGLDAPGEQSGWSEDDLALIQAVREQIGMALENRLLFEQTTEALAETSALYEIGQAISEARSVTEIFEAAIEGISRRSEPDRIVAGLLEPAGDPEDLVVVAGWSRDGGGAKPGAKYPLNAWESLYQVMERVGRFISADVEDEGIFSETMLDVYRRTAVRGLAGFQLRVRGAAYGMLLIYTSEPHDFSPEELRFYETVIQNASVALENQVLLKTTRDEADRRALLNEVMRTASANLDPAALIEDVTQLISERFAMPTLFWRWDGSFLYPDAVFREDGVALAPETGRPFGLADVSGVGAVVRSGQPLRWRFSSQPFRSARFAYYLRELHLEEAYAVPIMIRHEVLGVLVLGQQLGHPTIDDNEMAFLHNAAVNIGVALENARLYQDAQETAEKLKEVDRLKSEFLANMSHELRTPLNSIIGFSRVILKGIDGPLTDMQQTDLQAIYESGKHLLSLINDILDHSKIEAGKMEFVFEPVELGTLLRSVMSTAKALVKDKPIELQQHIPDDLPVIVADERRIRQVIINVMGNASKFTEEGYIALSATHDAQNVLIQVADTGIGIPPDRYDKVFAAFEQVDSSSTRAFGGTGLGLPVSKKFVEAHGGRIWFESEVGVGSTFYVSLPISGPPPDLDEGSEAGANAAPIPEKEGDETLTVLTVDDDAGVITLFRRYLSNKGYRVVGLTQGARVVEEAKRLKPYAITLDIIMPDKNGWEVIRDLKSDPETRNIPIVVCSIVGERDKGLSMGVADYLVKPILEQDLLDALERLSEQSDVLHILVVDDNPDDRNLLSRILKDAGYEVLEAPGGAEAIAMIHVMVPDLVVLDLMMPEVDGFAVLESMKAGDMTRSIPVIVVTAKDLAEAEREALTARVQALLQKGIFDQQHLLEDVEAALSRLTPAVAG
ncbi:MAG: GAF domain-containing protein [Anaerolineae bacterium]|nr:GAF domain-containing protein [Anaerolineae bacterium]